MACRHGFVLRDALVGVIVVFVPLVFTYADFADVSSTDRDGSARLGVEMVSSVRHHPADTADDVIRRNVEKALYDMDSTANANIGVRVTNGTVLLTGTVPMWHGNAARIHATRSVIGVRSIINRIRVVVPSDSRRL